MKRLLYLDKKSNEIEDILSRKKQVIIKAANIKKYPYQMIHIGYRVYLMNNNNENIILASGSVLESIYIENNMENKDILENYLNKSFLDKKKKTYIEQRKYISVFILTDIKEEYAVLDHSMYGKKDDWMIINPILD